MKIANNILYALAAALLMVGCAKVEPDFGNKQAEDLDITFQVGSYAAATKAGEAEYNGAPFGTFAVFTPGEFEQTKESAAVYMDGVQISKQSNVWKSTTTYRWPKAGKLSFASFSPYTAKSSASVDDENNIVFTDYTVGGDDLMYSTPVYDKTANEHQYYNDGVPTLFHHALSLVSFDFKYESPEGTEIVLNSASISSVAKTGSYTGGDAVWTAKSGAETAEYDIKAKDGNYFYVMPQVLDDVMLNINAEMQFHLAATDGSDVTVKTPIVVSVPLKTADLARWESNKQIHYTISISGDAALIKFCGSATDWTNVDLSEHKIVI